MSSTKTYTDSLIKTDFHHLPLCLLPKWRVTGDELKHFLEEFPKTEYSVEFLVKFLEAHGCEVDR
jgi:hypothetical protein